MSETQWYIEREGVEYGPCTWDGLQTLARQGTLRPTDLVRRDGDTFFVPAHQARCDAAVNAAAAAPQVVRQVTPIGQRKQISELAGAVAIAAPAAQPEAAVVAPALTEALERAVEEDLNLAMAQSTATEAPTPVAPVMTTIAAAPTATAPAAAEFVPEGLIAVTSTPETFQMESASVVAEVIAPKTIAPAAVLKTASPAETVVELEIDEVIAPAAEAKQPAAPVNFTGAAILALVCAVGGLFWFGLLLGFVSVVLAINALRAMGRNGALAPRGVAMAALMLGAADLIVLVSALASHARLATVLWN